VVDEAIAKDCDLIITHHPLFFQATHKVAAESFRGRIVNNLIEHKISLYCGHTNVDISTDGASFTLAKKLALRDISFISKIDNKNYDSYDNNITSGLGVVGNLPKLTKINQLADKLSQVVPLFNQPIKLAGEKNISVNRVVIISGSGDFILNSQIAFATNFLAADVFISSDLRHHPVLEFRQTFPQVQVLDIPHFSGEYICLENIQKRLANKFNLIGELSTISTDPYKQLYFSSNNALK
jgi:dinuclear metal center YbgI/SA1388 family protein